MYVGSGGLLRICADVLEKEIERAQYISTRQRHFHFTNAFSL